MEYWHHPEHANITGPDVE